MVKKLTSFVCQSCAYESSKWLGRCPSCNNWNSFIEEAKQTDALLPKSKGQGQVAKLIRLPDLMIKKTDRYPTSISELDRVLGGGIVPGSLVLVSGDPGIGKSTIASQLLENIGGIYVCAEESPQQVKIRWQRLGFQGKKVEFLADNCVDNLIQTVAAAQKKYRLIVIDSIQTVFAGTIRSSVGSASQIRECANILLQFAKKTGITIFIIGHITKEGIIAGPKILEHLVDVVLYLSGEKDHQYRLLQAVKNRFGATDEVGIFDMTETGLISVKDPTYAFLAGTDSRAGSCLTIVMQGLRPLLVEVQALCVKTKLAMPRRVAHGISISRLQVICAVLQKYAGLPLYEYDVFVGVMGGLKITEPAADLAIATAIYSSVKDQAVKKRTVLFGELGLLGDIRMVSFTEKRNKEAKKLRFTHIINPKRQRIWLRQALKAAIS